MPRRKSGESSDADKAPFMYYLHWDSSGRSCEADDFWKSEYVIARKCPESCDCHGIRPTHYGEPFEAPLVRRPTLSLDRTALCGFVHTRLFSAIRRHLVGCVVGPCLIGKSQRVLEDYRSYYAPVSQSVHIVYGPGMRPRHCRSCGLASYPGGTGGRVAYVLRSQLRGRHAHVEGVDGTFMITPWLAKRIDIWMLCKDIQLVEYPVLDEPLGPVPKQGAGPTDKEVAKWKPGEFLWRHPRAAKTVPPLPQLE
jgi:hypothetical protein